MLAEYARLNWVVMPAVTVGNIRLARVFQNKSGDKVGLWVVHPLEARPNVANKATILAQSGLRCAVHTTFDLERRPFWVMNHLVS